MSRTTVMAVCLGEKAERLEELQNSWGSAPFVWNALAMQYLGMGAGEYSLRTSEVLPMYKRPDMPSHQRAVLLMTYDNAIVRQADYKRAAADIRAFLDDFPPRAGYANHWARIAEIFDSPPDCTAIGFWMTSVSENPFQGEWNEELEEYAAPDLARYWDVYAELEK